MIKKTGMFLYFSIILCFLAIFIKPYSVGAQSKPLFGIQVKPIMPSGLFSTADESVIQKGVKYSVKPELGFNFGGVIRQRVYKGLSIESGLSYVKRIYNISLQDSNFSSGTRFRYINYEIPVLALIYIQLSERAFINNAFGFSFDFFPSHIYTESDSLRQYTIRKFWVLPALTANIGFEYRTKQAGYFYLGGSYHRMLSDMAYSRIEYQRTFFTSEKATLPLSGHYFSIDFKYFFPLRAKDPEPLLY